MAILSTRIQDYIGSFADTTALTDMANEVAKDIIHTAPPEMYPFFSNQVSFTSSAVYSESEALVNAKIFNVRLVAADGVERPCREIPPALAGRAGDTLEMIYATETDPVFYIRDAKINALPASKTVRFSAINYPTVDLAQSAIANFPNEAEHIVVLGTSAKAIMRMISDEIDNIQGLTISMVVYPAIPSMPSVPSISDLSISIAGIVSPSDPLDITLDAVTVDAFSSSPSYTQPVFELSSIPSIDSLNISTTIPVSPTLATITFSDIASSGDVGEQLFSVANVSTSNIYTGNAPTYVKPVLSLTTIPSVSALSISATPPSSVASPSFTYNNIDAQTSTAQTASIGVVPVYTSQSVVLTSVPSVPSFVAPSIPATPSSPDLSYSAFIGETTRAKTVGSVTATVPSYIKPVLSIPVFPTLNSLNSLLPSVPPSIVDASLTYTAPTVTGDGTELTSVSVLDTDNTIDVVADQIEFDQWWSTLAHLIEDEEDTELASLQVSKISSYISAYSAQMTNSLNEYNKILNEFQQNLSKYNADVSKYQAEVNTAIQKWQNDELQTKWNRWSTEYTNLLSQYNADMVNENNRIQTLNIEYQKDLQIQMEEARFAQEQVQQDANRIQATVDANAQRTYQAKADDYVQELQLFSGKLNKYGNELQTATQQFQSEFQKNFDLYRQENADKLQKYGLDINQALNEYNRSNSAFQAENQKNLANANMAQEQAQRDAEKAQNAENENKIRAYQKQVDEYSNQLGKLNADVNIYNQSVNKEVTEYRQNLDKTLQLYTSETSNQLSQYQADMNNALNVFNRENIVYQSAIQESMQNVQNTNQVNIASAQAAQQVAISNQDHDYQRLLQNSINNMQAIINSNNDLMAKYNAEVAKYQAEISTVLQEYQVNLRKEFDLWQTDRQTGLGKYSSDIQNNLNSFNKDSTVFQSSIQKEIQNAQMAQEKATGDARHKLDKYIQKLGKFNAEINNYGQRVNTTVTEFQNNMRKNIDLYNAEYQNLVSKFQVETASVGDENAKKLTEYTSKLGLFTQTSGELRNQYQVIKGEYDMALARFIGAPVNQGRQQR